jgi:hypothetical protein
MASSRFSGIAFRATRVPKAKTSVNALSFDQFGRSMK